MNPQGTSFIPQRPAAGKVKNRGVRKIYILAYISYVLFFGSAIAAAGTFFFTLTVDSQLAYQKGLLAAERDKFSESDIQSVRELEERMSIAQDRMNKHISVVSIFEALEQSAVQAIRFTSFVYERPNDNAPRVTWIGSAEKFNTIIFQREILQQNPVLAGATFNEVELVTKDTESETTAYTETVRSLTFSLSKEIDQSLVPYKARIYGESVVSTEDGSLSEAARLPDTEISSDVDVDAVTITEGRVPSDTE